MARSVEKKLVELGISSEKEIDQALLEDLIDIEVRRVGANYSVFVEENIFGNFRTRFHAKNEQEAVTALGKKMLGFANKQKAKLTKEALNFYLRIWHELIMKHRIKDKIREFHWRNLPYFEKKATALEIKNVSHQNKINRINRKIAKLESKPKVRLSKINNWEQVLIITKNLRRKAHSHWLNIKIISR